MQDILHSLSGLIRKNETIIVGFSGGPDSTFLMIELLKLRKVKYFNLIVAHVNYHLRMDSNKDKNFVEKFCKEHKLTLFTEKVKYDEKFGNIENWAREVRFNFFLKLCKMYSSKKIFLAHNLNDLIETYFLKIIKKSDPQSIYNLSKISLYKKAKIIRPLLNKKKEDIIKFLKNHNITFRVDSTNDDNNFSRNFLRNIIIAPLEKRFPEFTKNFWDIYERQKFINEHYFEYLKKKYSNLRERDDDFIRIPIDTEFSPYEHFVFVKFSLQQLGYNRALKANYYEQFKIILKKNGGKYLKLSEKYYIFKGKQFIYVYKLVNMKKYIYNLLLNKKGEYEIKIPFFKWKIILKKNVNIEVRPHRRGDFVIRDGKKKLLSKYLKKENVDSIFRYLYPVILVDNNIVALGNIKIFDARILSFLEVK